MKKILMYGIVFLIFIAGAFAITTDGAVFYLQAENNITDRSNNQLVFTNSNTGYATGIIDTGFDFNDTDYLQKAHTSLLTTSAFSVSLWSRPESTSLGYNVFKDGSGNTAGDFAIYTQNNKVYVQIQSGGGTQDTIIGTAPTDSWVHIVFTSDGGTDHRLYINGTQANTSSNSWDMSVNSQPLYLGSWNGASPLDGQMDEIFWVNYTLTSDNVSDLWNGGVGDTWDFTDLTTGSSFKIPTVVDFKSTTPITVSGTTFVPVFSGTFSPEYNGSAYLQAVLTLENQPQTKDATCRATIDGTDYNTQKSRTLQSNDIANVYLKSTNFTVVENTNYTYTVECSENNAGSMQVTASESLVSLLYNETGTPLNATFINQTFTVENITEYQLIYNSTFTTSTDATGFNKTVHFQGSIEYLFTGVACCTDVLLYTVVNDEQSPVFIRQAYEDPGSGSFVSYATNISENTTVPVQIWAKLWNGSPSNSDVNLTIRAGIIEYVQQPDQINKTNLTGLTTSSTSYVNLTSIKINNTGGTNEETLVTASISLNGTNSQTATFRFRSGDVVSQSASRWIATENGMITMVSVLENLPAGENTINLQALVDGGTVRLSGGAMTAKPVVLTDFVLSDFNISAVNAFNGSTIPIFNVTLDSGTVFFANGSDAQLFANGTLLNFTVSADGYLNKTFINVNTSTDFTAQMAQAYASFNAFELITNNSVTGSVLVNGTYNDTGNLFPLNVGNYTVTFNASGYFDKSTTVEILSLTNTSYNIYNVGNAQVNVSFYTNFTNASATNVTGYIYNDTYGFNESFDSSPNASYIFDIVQNITFTVVIDSPLYSLQNFTILTNSTYKNQSEYLYTFNSVLITFLDQDTLDSLNGTNVTIELISDVQTTLNYTTTGQFYVDLLSPSSYTVRYTADGYAESFYYFELSNQSDIQLTLYLINESAVTNVTFIVLDEINTLLEDAVIKVHKYNPNLGAYTIVEILLTNFEGEAVAPIELGAEFYYFIVEYPSGTIVKTTSPSYIYDTTVQIPVVLSAPLAANFFQTNDVATSLVFNNATDNFKYTFSDSANLLEGACLYVYRISTFDKTLYNSSCVTGASGQILINVANTTGVTYLAQGEIELTDETKIITDSLWKNFGAIRAFGTLGIFATIIILITLVLLGIWNPSVSIILTTFALALAKVIGFLSIGWEYIIGLIVLGVLLVIVISKKS